jgi:uncharacterized protein YaaQ
VWARDQGAHDQVVRQTCRRHASSFTVADLEGPGLEMSEPIEVSVGGAVIFVQGVEQFIQA